MTILLVVGAWLVLTAIGWLVLAPMVRSRRDALLPTAPLFGVVLLVVVLHDTTLVVSVQRGLLVVVAVLIVLAVCAFRRDPTWWRPSRAALAMLGVTAACGVLPAVWALTPSLAVGDSNVIQPSTNNDAFYYVTVADWLQHHRATDRPDIGATPEDPGVQPSYATARSHLDLGLRMGQELTQAAVATVLHRHIEETWYPLTALWVLLLPASGVAAALFFRLRLISGLVLGTMTSVSALVIFQLAAQNSDSLLGTVLLPLALGAVVRALGRDPLVSSVMAGVILTSLVGTYTELLPLIALALVVAVLARRPREVPRALAAAIVMLVAAFVVAPLVWVRAVRSLVFIGGITVEGMPSSFRGAPLPVILGRFLGLAGPGDLDVSGLAVGLGVALAAVGILATLLSRRWPFYLALVLPGAILSIYLVTVRERPYTQQRVVQLLLPLVLLVVVAGWDALWTTAQRRTRAGPGRRRTTPGRARPATLVAVVGALGATAFVVSNGVTDHDMQLTEVAKTRHVGPEFAEAARWIRDDGGADGDRTAVLVGDFFSQLWITDALRDSPDVAYPALFTSYQAATSYWDGEPRRWLLTDSGAIMRVDSGVVVKQNDRFALLDLSKGAAVVVVPADEFGQNSYLVLRSPSAPTEVNLVGSARDRTPTDVAPLPGYGEVIGPDEITPGMTVLRLDLPGAGLRVVLGNAEDVFQLRKVRFGRPT
jgi:hypothetical protein